MTPSIGVAEFYAGKTIFMTGATGFMGKVLIEKLLRCCPDIKKIYLLMRQKKGQDANQRLNEFVNCKVFDNLQDISPKSFNKLQVIPGDVLLDDLGISIEDWDTLQRECQIIFHCAACVRFDMPLREVVQMNTTGTKKVLKLAEGMKNIEVFLHVSTSYCRCEIEVLEEKLYPSKHKPQHIMDCVEWMDDDLITRLQPELIKPQPNTYAYTKSLTEDLVSQYANKFPIAIARPSIVTAAYKEPMPGWVDNMNGPTGMMVGAAKGVIRTMLCEADYLADVVPVDMAVNGCILLAYSTAVEKSKELRICNITQSGVNPITWGQALEMGRQNVKDFPFTQCLWYPDGGLTNSRLQHEFLVFFTHLLPAYFIDFLMLLINKKPFMVKVQQRVSYGLSILQYYTTKEWKFANDKYRALGKAISNADREIFYTDMEAVDLEEYIRNYMKGARQYCCKEDPETLPKAKRLHTRNWLPYMRRLLGCVVDDMTSSYELSCTSIC